METEKSVYRLARPSRHGIIRSGTGFSDCVIPFPSLTAVINRQTACFPQTRLTLLATTTANVRNLNPSMLSILYPVSPSPL